MGKLLLVIIAGFLLIVYVKTTSAVITNEAASAIALKSMGKGGSIVLSDQVGKNGFGTSHVFIGKTADKQLFFIRVVPDKVEKLERIGYSLL